jgi:hypothetical protein
VYGRLCGTAYALSMVCRLRLLAPDQLPRSFDPLHVNRGCRLGAIGSTGCQPSTSCPAHITSKDGRLCAASHG